MRRRFDWRHMLGAALLLAAVAAVVLAAFVLMSRTSREELLLADSPDERFGWSYEILVDGEVRPYEPKFEGRYGVLSMPEETEAVRITREMTEDIPKAELEWMSFLDGVELHLDGVPIYTDFPWEVRRDADGFLRPEREDWERLHRAQGDAWWRGRVTLPADYLGKELSVITYFPEEWGIPVPEYPILGTEDGYIARFLLLSMPSSIITVICALLSLTVSMVFLLDNLGGSADAKMPLLCVYFVLLFLNEAFSAYMGYYSDLARVDLTFLRGLYVAPLYLYLALRLTGRWKYLLCGGIAAWALYEGARMFMNVRQGNDAIHGRSGLGAFVLFLVVAAAMLVEVLRRARRSRWSRRRMAVYGLIAALVALICVANKARGWHSARGYLVDGIIASIRDGNFSPALSLVTDFTSIMALIVVISEYARRTLRGQQEMGVLQERARQTMEGYQRLLTAQDTTNALRYEMRHHMIALSGMLGGGDAARAKRYVDAVAGDLDRLPAGRYSQNVLVDVIAGSYLDRAWAQDIRVEHRLNVPPELNIADEDLSVFLSNMLQNALEACERMDAAGKRSIRLEMRLRGDFLFIKCVNSAPEEPAEREERPDHGYGLAAMRRVAEKYNSTLIIERAKGEFSIKSDLCLKES